MRWRSLLLIGLTATILAAWYGHATSAAACGSEAAIREMRIALNAAAHLDSILVNDVRTVAGGPFARRQVCTAEVAQISSHVRAAEMDWRRVDYVGTRRAPGALDAGAESSAFDVRLGGSVPLATVSIPYWRRILGMF